jgi:transcriptional regulator with XRE-family HTH domain
MKAENQPPTWPEYVRDMGINMQKQRLEHGLSQERLAYAAGLSRFAYQQFEKGESKPHTPANPSLKNIMAIAQALGIELDDLLPSQWPDLRAK